ncbi:hypothetical protein ACPCHT_32195 [Nucisporomicrobium flavum]|uniref:hypothetical protein n=1 Tax=Nucisporomicrobium flavum TaxID=2785915 RepID=UPI003C2C39CB
MGIDLRSIAVPLHADPVQAIRADPALWETASEHPPFANPWPGEALPQISQALLAVLGSGAVWAQHFGDRSQQQAEYLLDPAAYRTIRTWQERESSLAYRIINGDEVFAEHATSGQGFPWRCSTQAFLAAAVAQIDGLDTTVARREFSVAEMADLGLYKVHREEDDDHAFKRILFQLREFAQHCRLVVARGFDVIVNLY